MSAPDMSTGIFALFFPVEKKRKGFKCLLTAVAGLAGIAGVSALVSAGHAAVKTAGQSLAGIDHLMQTFMARHRVPGAALAITVGNRLVYVRGFGAADREQGRPVTPRSLFRIASASKPFTATAILQLVEAGRLGLGDPVLPLLKDSLRHAPGVPGDERLASVTIRHLLQHTAGWDRAESGFYPLRTDSLINICRAAGVVPPGTPATVVRFVLAQPLDFTPGDRYAYSNVGYLVLGRVVESVSGLSYETFVRQAVLRPLGIDRMRIGGSDADSPASGEVRYYSAVETTIEARFGKMRGQRVALPYDRCIEVQEAAGGWVAAVVDLARFITALHYPEGGKPLGRETVMQMVSDFHSAPEGASQRRQGAYALGWYVEKDTAGRTVVSHGGRLPGSAAFMGWRSDGIGAAVLFNTDTTPQNEPILPLFLAAFETAIDAIAAWPDHDQFPIYFPATR